MHYRHWSATNPTVVKRAVVLFHRGHEHSARMQHVIDELGLDDCHFFAWDARGHGENAGERGFSPSFARLVKDAYEFAQHITANYSVHVENMVLIGQSVGGLIVSTLVHDYALKVRAMVIASPAFKIKLYVPFARFFLRLWYSIKGVFYVNSYVKPQYLTHDEERIASYKNDPLIARPIAVNVLLDVYDTADRIVQDAHAIYAPTLLLISEADWIVHQAPQHLFFERLGSSFKQKIVLDGFYHDTLGEKNRAHMMQQIKAFIQSCYHQNIPIPDLKQAHLKGYTYDEACTLSQPLPWWSLKKWNFALMRLSIRMLGQYISRGLKLGVATGFDSGSTLDYVYKNTPQGDWGLGKVVDANYLNAIGWRGIRVRKQHVEALLAHACKQLTEQNHAVHIVDVAAGHGRYVLEGITQLETPPQSILLRDYSELNQQLGQQLILSKGLSSIARFEVGDAFDPESIAKMTHKPNIVIVSGLYELFHDNTLLQQSLTAIYACMADEAYIIYTGQPWHPQLEMIARVLTSHRQGQAWVMRRRVQMELDQLVEGVGFEKIDQQIDQWGIFTVSIAHKQVR